MNDSKEDLLWSETSDQSSSSSDTTTPTKMNESDDDKEQKYKHELLQDVFKEPKSENDYEVSSKKKKKNKEKLNLKIKSEPESDLESIKKNKKSKRKSSINHEESNSYADDSYLDLRVKEETLMSPTDSSRKHKKKKKVENESYSLSDEISEPIFENNDKIKESNTDIDDSYLEQRIEEETLMSSSDSKSKHKKKKKHDHESLPPSDEISESTVENSEVKKKSIKKKKQKYEEEHDSVVKELFSADETIVMEDEITQKKKHKKKKNKKRDISPIEVNHNGYHTDQDNVVSEDVVDDAMIVDEPHIEVQQNNSVIFSTVKPRQSRITDRLLFEDDPQAQTILDTSKNSSQSFKLQQFLKSEGNLQACHINYPDELTISPNDEVFLLHCPTEVEMSYLNDLTLSLDGTNRIKLGGQKYESIVDTNNKSNVTLLLFEDQEHKIKSFPCTATIRFRKRLPKAHFVMDNIIENDQTNCIPLPETKSRHPLFGPNYKKAIKLPDEIQEQLQHEPIQESTPHKKKKKKHKNKEEIVQEEEKMEEVKVRRKRQRSSTSDVPSKRARMAPTWEDEQSIEQNLFDY